MDRKQLKEKSKLDLGGSLFNSIWLTAVVVLLINGALQGAGSFFSGSSSGNNASGDVGAAGLQLLLSLIGLAISIALLPLGYGLYKTFLSAARGKGVKLTELFDGYKEGWKQNALTSFMSGLFTMLWSLLLLVPGIVKSYSYSMALYLRNDNPEYDWKTAINESRHLMDGHKMELFILDLSFLGWYIVGALCLGIGMLWVQAYHQAARANFYNELVGHREQSSGTVEIGS